VRCIIQVTRVHAKQIFVVAPENVKHRHTRTRCQHSLICRMNVKVFDVENHVFEELLALDLHLGLLEAHHLVLLAQIVEFQVDRAQAIVVVMRKLTRLVHQLFTVAALMQVVHRWDRFFF
jgi:hypothetical protein